MNPRHWPVVRSQYLVSILLLTHLAGVLYYLPPREILANPPIARTDYTTHFYQAATVNHFLREAGHPWGYDAHHLAGYPLGTVFDVNNKGLEVATWLLASFIDVTLAFNLAVLVLFDMPPQAGKDHLRHHQQNAGKQRYAALQAQGAGEQVGCVAAEPEAD
jgi:hypothetical protein